MNKKFQLCALGLLAVAACSHGARADVQLNSLFTSNMVLQRDQMLPVWDTSNVGEKDNKTTPVEPLPWILEQYLEIAGQTGR